MEQKIKTFQTIHLAICSGVVVAYILTGNITTEMLSLQGINAAHLPYLAVPVLALFLSNFMFKSQLKQANTKLKTEDNLGIYQTASIIRWAILEGAAFFLLFAQPKLIVFGIAIIAYLLFLRPSEDKIITDIQTYSK
jgi:hypothetical protein